LGGRNFLGNPKQPTLSIYQLIEGEYQIKQFRGDDPIVSPTFPAFKQTPNQIFLL
jgi:Uma2 family endonuclease